MVCPTRLGRFPLAPGSKVPAIPGGRGVHDATTDPATIRAWWAKYPNANIGIACGASGLVVLDVDVKHDALGMESWRDLLAEHGPALGETVCAETPTKGMHFYYRAKGRLGNSTGKLGPGLDVRANGGYVAAAPSVTPEGSYGWALGFGPHERALSDLPDCLAALLSKQGNMNHMNDMNAGERIGQGGRNSALASLAGVMRRRGASQAALEAALLAENAARCAPPLPDQEVRAIAVSVGRYEPEAAKGRREYILADLLGADFPEPAWLVPGLLPAGLALLCGRPKIGKSWAALQLAVAVGSGGRFLGRQVEQGRALYVALEDSPRRIQHRLKDMGAPADCELSFAFDWQPLNGDGLYDLEAAIQDGVHLGVIDTLARAVKGRMDWDNLGDVTGMLGGLQRMAQDTGACILLIDHHRKGNGLAANVIDDVMGSTGKSAVADTVWGLYRQRGEQGATLRVTGRDIEEAELSVSFDVLSRTWHLDGAAEHGVQAEILDTLQHLGGTASVTDISNHLGKDQGNISRELAELLAKRRVAKGESHKSPYTLIQDN